jgi:hypothetical protein
MRRLNGRRLQRMVCPPLPLRVLVMAPEMLGKTTDPTINETSGNYLNETSGNYLRPSGTVYTMSIESAGRVNR